MQSLGPVSKREAERIRDDKNRKSKLESLGVNPKALNNINIDDYIRIYLEHSKARKKSRTYEADKMVLTDFRKYIGSVNLRSIRLVDIDLYCSNLLKKHTPGGVNFYFRHLRAAFNKAVEWDHLHHSPIERLKELQVDKTNEEEKYLTVAQIDQFMDAIKGDPIELILQFYLLTGCRLNEAVQLMGEDVDLENGIIFLRAAKTKTRTGRQIYFKKDSELGDLLHSLEPENGLPVFQSSRDGKKAWSHYWISTKTLRIFNRLALPWASVQTLRNTYATQLAHGNVPITDVQKALGHSTPNTTEKYYIHSGRERLEKLGDMLPYSIKKKAGE